MSSISASMPASVAEELIFQYDNLFHVLSVTIRPLSRKQWINGETAVQTPVRQAGHIVSAIEFYATGKKDGSLARFGFDIGAFDGEILPEQLPSPVLMIDYIDKVRADVHQWLTGCSEADLLRPTPSMGWQQRGMTRLGHILYVLRHSTFHLGLLCAILDCRGIKYGVFK